MKLEAIKLEIRKIVQERSINAIAKLQQKNIEDISKALEFYKKNKHTDKKEAFIKVLKKLGNEKLKLAGELDLKVSGMYKDAEYKGESVVSEDDTPCWDTHKVGNPKTKVSSKTGKRVNNCVPKGEGIEEGENGLWDNIRKKKARGGKPAHKNSKAHKDAVKAGDKIKANESVVNEMSMGFDNMTGLFYLQGVPFTRERIKEVILFMKKAQVKSKVNQFEYTPALIVKDKVGNESVVIDSKNYEILLLAFKKNSAKLASDKDFK